MKLIALLSLPIVASCTSLLALDDRPCPCVLGYTCDATNHICVRDGTVADNAPEPDASVAREPGTVPDGPQDMWSSPTEIATAALGPRLFSDPDGNVFLIWTLVGPVGVAQRWTPATGWSSAGSTPVAFSHVGTGAGGNAIGVGGTGTTTSHAQASLYSPDSGWSAAQQVDTETSPVYVSSVTSGMDDSANALVVFAVRCTSCPTSGIKSRLYTPGLGWGPITPVSPPGDYAYQPRMAMAGNGMAVVGYGQYDGEPTDTASFWAARYTPAGGWAPPQRFPGGGEGGDAAIDAAGNAMVVWENFNARTIFSSRNTGSGWSTAVPISGTAATSRVPILAMNAAGDAVAGWNTTDGVLYAARFVAASGTWGAALQVSPAAISPGYGSVALDAAGNALFIWEDLDSPVHVWASRLPAGAIAWNPAVRLDTAGVDGDADYQMSAACVPTGTCFGAWTQYDTHQRRGIDRLYLSMRP